jgi:acyl-CoA thioesterase
MAETPDLVGFADMLRLTEERGDDEAAAGPARWSGQPTDRGQAFVDAGTLAAYLTYAAATAQPGRDLRATRAAFLRAVRPAPLVLVTTPLHLGSTYGALDVRLEQDGRLCAHAVVTSGPRSPDLLRHQAPSPTVPPPLESAEPSPYLTGPAPLRVVDGVDPFDPATVRDPRWQVWVDASGLPRDRPGLLEAFLAAQVNAFQVQAAVIGHGGISHHTVHDELLAAITGCELVFHDLPSSPGWLLFDQRSEYAGGGWLYGHGAVHDRSGRRIASFSEDAILRTRPEGRPGPF